MRWIVACCVPRSPLPQAHENESDPVTAGCKKVEVRDDLSMSLLICKTAVKDRISIGHLNLNVDLLLFNRLYSLEMRSVMLVFSTPLVN